MTESTARNGLSAFVPLLAGTMLVIPFYVMPPWHVWLVAGVVWVTAVWVLCWLWSRHNYEAGIQQELRQKAPDRPRQAPQVMREPPPAPTQRQPEKPKQWPPPPEEQSF